MPFEQVKFTVTLPLTALLALDVDVEALDELFELLVLTLLLVLALVLMALLMLVKLLVELEPLVRVMACVVPLKQML